MDTPLRYRPHPPEAYTRPSGAVGRVGIGGEFLSPERLAHWNLYWLSDPALAIFFPTIFPYLPEQTTPVRPPVPTENYQLAPIGATDGAGGRGGFERFGESFASVHPSHYSQSGERVGVDRAGTENSVRARTYPSRSSVEAGRGREADCRVTGASGSNGPAAAYRLNRRLP